MSKIQRVLITTGIVWGVSAAMLYMAFVWCYLSFNPADWSVLARGWMGAILFIETLAFGVSAINTANK